MKSSLFRHRVYPGGSRPLHYLLSAGYLVQALRIFCDELVKPLALVERGCSAKAFFHRGKPGGGRVMQV